MAPTIAILGAGPAGSVAATMLARSGLEVALIEQHRFPRDKVCGECLSALGIQTLSRLGLDAAVRSAGAIELNTVALYPPAGDELALRLPRPMWGISRRVLDWTLLEAARTAGAEVLQPVRCERIEWKEEKDSRRVAQLSLRNLESNSVDALSADLILLADGKGALLDDRPAPTGDLGIKGHFTGVRADRSRIGLFGLEGHYVGLAPVENDGWNVAFAVPTDRVRQFGGDLDGLWESMLAANSALRCCFADARRTGGWLAAPLPRFPVADRWPQGVIPIGNAAAALEPIGGEGMGLAIHSASLAAEMLWKSSGRPSDEKIDILRRKFKALWNTRRLACRALALALAHPELAEAGLSWARSSDGLARGVLNWMGKT